MGKFVAGRWTYVKDGRQPWKMYETKTNRFVRIIPFKDVKKRFSRIYDQKLVKKVMRRQGLKGKSGRKVAKGIVRAYRLGIIGSDALY